MSEKKLTLSERYQKINVSDDLLDQWANGGVNILIMGERGTGKTERVLNCFERNFKNYVIFSGATLDPWTDLIGIPRVSGEDGDNQFINYVRPQEINEDIEAFFIDEYNRSKPAVKNAIMELCQFGSINGKKFPKLKVVWAAINPPPAEDDDEDEFYSVDHIDPAQLDRFKVIIRVPNEPCVKFFRNRYGKQKGEALVLWWKDLPNQAQKYISPRRLQYVGDAFNNGLDIKFFLPINCNVDSLVRRLSLDEKDLALYEFKKNPSRDSLTKLIKNDDSIWQRYKKEILSSDGNMSFIAGSIPSECYATEIKSPDFLKSQAAFYINGDKYVREELDKIIAAGGDESLKKKLSTLDLIYSDEPWLAFDFSINKNDYQICKKSVCSFKEYISNIRNELSGFVKNGKLSLTSGQLNTVPKQVLDDLVSGHWNFNCDSDKTLVTGLLKKFISQGNYNLSSVSSIATVYNTAAITAYPTTSVTQELTSLYRLIETNFGKSKDLFIPPSQFEFIKLKPSKKYLSDWEKITKIEK